MNPPLEQKISTAPYLSTGTPNSFAAISLEKRLPRILNNLLRHVDTQNNAAQSLRQLAVEMQTGTITPLASTFPGTLSHHLKPYVGRSWNDMPFLTVELYFYARILLAFGHTATTPADPFQELKRSANQQAIAQLVTQQDYCDPNYDISALLHWVMSGNAADLSQAVVPDTDQISLLIDDSQLAKTLFNSGLQRIDYVLDNAGIDVLADLLLIRRISQYGSKIVVHVRPWPMFMSDMILTDVHWLLEKLKTFSEPKIRQLGKDIDTLLCDGQLTIQASPSLGLPISFCESKTAVEETFQDSALVIFKGDLNYRFFAGDRHWPHTTSKNHFLERIGRPVISLRTLKSEVLVGLSAEILAKTHQLESDWLTCGRYGIIQVFAENK